MDVNRWKLKKSQRRCMYTCKDYAVIKNYGIKLTNTIQAMLKQRC